MSLYVKKGKEVKRMDYFFHTLVNVTKIMIRGKDYKIKNYHCIEMFVFIVRNYLIYHSFKRFAKMIEELFI